MLRKALIVVWWFPVTFVLIIINLSLLSMSSLRQPVITDVPLSTSPIVEDNFQITASAGTAQVLGTQVVAGDARSFLLGSFLERHRSPMSPYAGDIVENADRYGIDFRLVTAIAMCESNLGKRMPKKDSYNAWGIAVYTGQTNGATFHSWPQAIEWVSRYIKEKYYDRGLTDLREIGEVYAPPSVNNDYSWTNCVSTFQNSIL